MQPELFDAVPDVRKSAVISDDDLYRYELTRHWSDVGRTMLWVMLNPSTADADQDDPTIRRCIGFAKSWGYGSLIVANLFAYRATNPEALTGVADPIGPENDRRLLALARTCFVVAAWGASVPQYWRHRPTGIAQQLRDAGVALHHIGLTKEGHPRHPLYVRGDAVPTLWAAQGGKP